jgi:adenylate cyclase
VVEESDGDLMGDGINIAARLEGVAKPGAICLSEDAYRQVKGRLDLAVHDLGPRTRLRPLITARTVQANRNALALFRRHRLDGRRVGVAADQGPRNAPSPVD